MMMGFYPPVEDVKNEYGGTHTKIMDTAQQKDSKCKNISVISIQ